MRPEAFLETYDTVVALSDGTLSVTPRGDDPRPHYPIDHFLRSLAAVQGPLAAFVPLTIEVPAVNKPSEPDAIRVQVQRPTGMVTVNWPVQDGGACAAWLREWLK